MKRLLVFVTGIAICFAITTVMLILQVLPPFEGRVRVETPTANVLQADNVIEVTTPFQVPPLDLRGYDLDHFEMEQWFLERINYHRENYGIHPYVLYTPAIVTSIEHSVDMRDNDMSSLQSSTGVGHQARHNVRMGWRVTERVTSAHFSSHDVEDGPVTKEKVYEIVDRVFTNEGNREFLLNPTYYYIGIGFSIQENGRGRLSITMSTPPGEVDAHRARSDEEKEAHRQEYLERVRRERGWTGE